jgi:hypothetical protein
MAGTVADVEQEEGTPECFLAETQHEAPRGEDTAIQKEDCSVTGSMAHLTHPYHLQQLVHAIHG